MARMVHWCHGKSIVGMLYSDNERRMTFSPKIGFPQEQEWHFILGDHHHVNKLVTHFVAFICDHIQQWRHRVDNNVRCPWTTFICRSKVKGVYPSYNGLNFSASQKNVAKSNPVKVIMLWSFLECSNERHALSAGFCNEECGILRSHNLLEWLDKDLWKPFKYLEWVWFFFLCLPRFANSKYDDSRRDLVMVWDEWDEKENFWRESILMLTKWRFNLGSRSDTIHTFLNVKLLVATKY